MFKEVELQHWVFLQQTTFDNLTFVTNEGIKEILFGNLFSSRLDFVNLGLRIGRLVLDPKFNFEKTYLDLHGGPLSPKGKVLPQLVNSFRDTLSKAVTQIL
jgi:hypothetical protein